MRLPFARPSSPTPFDAAPHGAPGAPDADASLLVSSELAAAERLVEPGVDIVLVRRRLPAQVADAAARRSAFGPVFGVGAKVDVASSHQELLSGRLDELGDGPLRQQVATDIVTLTRTWGALTGRRHARARISLVDSDNCRKLHNDALDLRILVTYVGPGTWLVPEEALDRSFVGVPGEPESINRRICPDPARLVQAGAGDVVFLKGLRWGTGARGAVHRSPAVEGTGERRLVLTIDGMGCGC